MGIKLSEGEIHEFIGLFYRTNAKAPPPRPYFNVIDPLTKLVITKGMLKLTLGDKTVDIVIPVEHQTADEDYVHFKGMLAMGVTRLLGVPQLEYEILQAMTNAGLVAQYYEGHLHINPLSWGVGETDQF